MILRRVTKHVKEQNWFAVGLDFFIVVVGILIAFQITNWSEAREQKRLHDDAFERVIDEMHTNLQLQGFIRDGVRVELPIVQKAIEDLQACRDTDDAMKNIEAALIPLNNPYVQLLQYEALEQYLDNDSFLQFQVTEDRSVLVKLMLGLQYLKREGDLQAEVIGTQLRGMGGVLRPGALNYESVDQYSEKYVGKNELSRDSLRQPVLAIPLSEACKDQGFLDGFFVWESQAFNLAYRAAELSNRIHLALEALGRPVDVAEEEIE